MSTSNLPITATDLFEKILERITTLKPDFDMPPLEREMLMECCEHTVASHFAEEARLEVLILACVNAFETCKHVMNAMINSIIPASADTITLNYRNQTFVIR